MGGQSERRYSTFELEVEERTCVFFSQAGVFSHGEADDGSMLLIETVLSRVRAGARVLDLGCGLGLIGIALSRRCSEGEVWMTDSDVRAVRLTEKNVEANRVDNATVLLGDGTLDLPPRLRFDLVVSNPPTHSGKEVLREFIEQGHHVLRPGGRMFIVVNRLLSAGQMMEEVFGNAEQVERRNGFVVFASQKPRLKPGERGDGKDIHLFRRQSR